MVRSLQLPSHHRTGTREGLEGDNGAWRPLCPEGGLHVQRARWESIVQALSAPPQRVHGDAHGGNLLTDGQEVTGIIDCDHLQLAPRGYDLDCMAFGVRWRLDGNQPSQPVDRATPFITRQLLTGYDAVSRLTRQENDDLPALALFTALGLIDFFIAEHDLVEESWLRTVHWIGDNFDALRLPASAFDGHEDLVKWVFDSVGLGRWGSGGSARPITPLGSSGHAAHEVAVRASSVIKRQPAGRHRQWRLWVRRRRPAGNSRETARTARTRTRQAGQLHRGGTADSASQGGRGPAACTQTRLTLHNVYYRRLTRGSCSSCKNSRHSSWKP